MSAPSARGQRWLTVAKELGAAEDERGRIEPKPSSAAERAADSRGRGKSAAPVEQAATGAATAGATAATPAATPAAT